MGRKTRPELKPYHRLSELVRLVDTSRGRVLRMLARSGIERRPVGSLKLVFVCDIKLRMAALWRSIVAFEQARNVAHVLESLAGG